MTTPRDKRRRPLARETLEWQRARHAELAEVRHIVAWMRQHRGYGWLAQMERDGVMCEELPGEWLQGVRPRAKSVAKLREYAQRFGYRPAAPAPASTGDALLLDGRRAGSRTLDLLRAEQARSGEGKAVAEAAALAALRVLRPGSPVRLADWPSVPAPLDSKNVSAAPPHPLDGGRVGEGLGPASHRPADAPVPAGESTLSLTRAD